jgi:outer membrane biosynthesis protein TonB
MKPTHSSVLRMVLLFTVLALAVACTKTPNDAQATAEIQAKLGADSGLQNKQIDVKSDKGVVTLSGVVDNDAEREAAARYASTEPGVKQVINNLQLGSGTAAAAPAPQVVPEPAPPAPAPSRSEKPSPRRHRHESPSKDEMAQSTPPPPVPASQPAPAPAPQAVVPPPPPPEPQKVTLPSGTSLAVRLVDTIDSATAQTGDQFHATLDAPVALDGDVVIPAHYDVEGHLINAQSSGKFQGRALLELQLDRIKVGDRWYNIDTDHFKQETGARGKNTAEKVGAGAVAGAILGGIFGGGKGAAVGSVAGAGAGGGVQAASKKPDIKLSSERILTFTLQAPVTIVPTTKPARGGQKLETGSGQQ